MSARGRCDRAVAPESAVGRFCCKSRKIPGDVFFERNEAKLCSPSNMAPRPLAKPPVSLSLGDEVPHIFIRETHQRPRKILISGGKRLLQQNLPQPDSCTAANSSLSAKASQPGHEAARTPLVHKTDHARDDGLRLETIITRRAAPRDVF